MSSHPRSPRPVLSVPVIVSAALHLLDSGGLAPFSMRALGKSLGVDPMAVYYYVPDQGTLFDLVVDEIYREVNWRPQAGVGSARAQIENAANALRSTLLAHPHVLPLVATRPAGPGVQELAGYLLGVLAQVGIEGDEAFDTLTCLTVYVLGHALAQVGVPVGGAAKPPVWPGPGHYDPDRQFAWGLGALLDGLFTRYSTSK